MSHKLYIGISRDHSGSMRSMSAAAMVDYNETIASIREQAQVHGIDTVVSVVRCGVNTRAQFERESTISSINVLQPLTKYIADGNSTPLYDSIGELITQFKSLPDANDPNVQFMVMAITDGHENSSRTWNSKSLSREITQLTSTDKWSFVFRVPKGHRKGIAQSLSLFEDNVLEWETSSAGMQKSTVQTREAFTTYFADTAAGTRSTTKFYTNLDKVSIKEVKAALIDISAQVQIWNLPTASTQSFELRQLCEQFSGKPFLKGSAFYQLTKTESEVQDYKLIMIRDKKSGNVYAGAGARQMLNLPTSGTVKVAPGNHANYDIFIQSTSVNRKIYGGTTVIYWPNVGTNYKEGASAPVATPVISPQVNTTTLPVPKPPKLTNGVPASHKDMYLMGYKAGRSKQKNRASELQTSNDVQAYIVGFNDGKAKKPAAF